MRLGYIIPFVLFLALAVALYVGLQLKPRDIPSALIDKPVPTFDLGPVKNYSPGLKTANLQEGEVSLVNIFASWCGPCRVEHPVFMALSKTGEVTLHGINYKDDPDNASNWLARYGNPYERTGADRNGRVGIDWGVYGVPETFVIDQSGRIRYKHVGVMTQDILDKNILPLVRQLKAGK
jgi:cytochrome c biogenesis protein CcmG, thiol:disulfide interchange protein DsbE